MNYTSISLFFNIDIQKKKETKESEETEQNGGGKPTPDSQIKRKNK